MLRSRSGRAENNMMSTTSLLSQVGGGGDDFILASLVESGFITGSIKTVLERGKQDAFQDSLDRFLDKQRREIQTLCSDNYEEFLKSVSHLKKVRDDAQQLRKRIEDLNKQVQDAGRTALDRGKSLLTFRTIGDNVQSAMDTVEMCRYVSSLSAKANQQINDQKYYPALITLDELEKSLRNVHRFEFAQFLDKHVPKFKQKIKACVERDFNDWLVDAKSKSQKIGELMLDHSINDHRGGTNTSIRSQQYQQYVTDPDDTDATRSVFEIVELGFAPVYTCKHIFETMYCYEQFKGLHYKRNRDIQLRHELDHFPSPVGNETNHHLIPDLKRWMERVLGFFAVENAVLHSTSSLLSSVEISSMWERTRMQIISILDAFLTRETKKHAFLSIKNLTLNFSTAVSTMLNLDIAPVIDLLVGYRSAFEDVLKSHARDCMCIQIFQHEPYEPYDLYKNYGATNQLDNSSPRGNGSPAGSSSSPIAESTFPSDEKQKISQLEKFDLIESDLHQITTNKSPSSPATSPTGRSSRSKNTSSSSSSVAPAARRTPPTFSYSLVLCAWFVENYIKEYMAYRKSIISPSSHCEEVKSGIVELLTLIHTCMGTTFDANDNLQDDDDDRSQSLKRNAQVVVNLQYMLDRLVPYFDKVYRDDVIKESSPSPPRSVIYLTSLRNQVLATLQRGETSLLKSVTKRCSFVLNAGKHEVDWAPTLPAFPSSSSSPPPPDDGEPHAYVTQLVTYLRRVDDCTKFVAYETRERLFLRTFQYISQFLFDLLCSTRYEDDVPKSLNMMSIKSLQKDMCYLNDRLIKSVPVMSAGLTSSIQNLTILFDFLIKENVRELALMDERVMRLLQDAVNDDGVDIDQLDVYQHDKNQYYDELIEDFCKRYNIANVNAERVKQLSAVLDKMRHYQIELLKEVAENARKSRKKTTNRNFLFGFKKK
ncbi:hypothetical protein AKO1_011428 [Acrasis kona]|uniref:Exocyst complex component EXOC6/Sec15 N-terminal domain-containing protein n=1 Tax=Acrasis kona TaxID=1008807 RepID=A0AAW2ZL54_9EUKA